MSGIHVNGLMLETSANTLGDFLATQGIYQDQPGIAIAFNDTVIQRSAWPVTILRDGDRLEIVTAKAGG